jgi:hypothetical protein
MNFCKCEYKINRLFSKAMFYKIIAIKINARIPIRIYLHTYTRMKYENRYAPEKIGKKLFQSRYVFRNQYLFTN